MAAPLGFPSSFQLPTVTEHDLQTFHAQHFSSGAIAHFPFGPAPVSQQPELDDGDGLGYYPDGVKRTLTDEQIAIFRHSEIQSLLKERRHAREKREAEISEEGEIDEDSSSELVNESRHGRNRDLNSPLQRGDEGIVSEAISGAHQASTGEIDGKEDFGIKAEQVFSKDGNGLGGEGGIPKQVGDEDEACEESLHKEQHQTGRKAKKRKRNLGNMVEQNAEEKGERRIAREQDENKDIGETLDYGDDVGPPDSSIMDLQLKKEQTQHPLGRRIVAYGDDDDRADDITETMPVSTEAKQQEKKVFLWPKIGS